SQNFILNPIGEVGVVLIFAQTLKGRTAIDLEETSLDEVDPVTAANRPRKNKPIDIPPATRMR
ncbi:MAG: hypothetical protein DLM52_02260, partial [Chthoniobacterales bacterium]